MSLQLTGIYRYPVKSCRGEALTTAGVEAWGLAGDRRWMVVGADGEALTARVHPRMVLLTPALVDGGLRLTGPGMPALTVASPDGPPVPVTVHGNPVTAVAAGSGSAEWFSGYLGVPARLVFLADTGNRHPNPRFARPEDTVAFADAYPILVTQASSLADLNDVVARGRLAAEGPLAMRRFRPGLVVSGGPAWSEDGWRRLRIGAATFRAVKGCDRCVLTTVDPDTGVKGKEPIASLARVRRWDGKTWFGMNLIPDDPGSTVSVGDTVEVLESVPAPDGPPR